MDAKEEFHDQALLVVGSCLAGRLFRACDDGVLTGLVYRQPWTNGANTAICPYVGLAPEAGSPRTPIGWRQSVYGAAFHGHAAHERRTPHQPGGLKCSCGFWAFHQLDMSAEWISLARTNAVVGLIWAHGVMTRGTKGYRAQHATIAALVTPDWAHTEPVEAEPTIPPRDVWANVVNHYDVPVFSTLDAAVAGVKSRRAAA